MKYYLQTPLKNLSFLFLFLFCTSSLVRAQNKYTLDADDVRVNGQGVITGCICEFTNKDIIIPETIGGQTITGIGGGAFWEKGLIGLTFPSNSSLTTIGNFAFHRNALTSLDFPASLTTIGGQAFYLNRLTSVTFPASLTTIGASAFSWNHLDKVTFPASLTTIGGQAFYLNRLTSVTFPNNSSLETIGDAAFSHNNLISVDFPASLTTIGNYTFSSNALTKVTFSDGLTTTSNIQSIGAGAFSNNPEELTGITLPTNSNGGFNGYKDSGGIPYDPNDDFTEFSRNLWANIDCHELTDGELTIENRVITECNYGFANKSICIPDMINGVTITGIADRVFQSEGLISVEFPASLETIGERAFSNNYLASLDFPDKSSLTTIGDDAFYANALTSLDLPASLASIGEGAFYQNALTSVTFPENSRLTSIGRDAFSWNFRLAPIKLPTNSNGGFEGYKDSGGSTYNLDDGDVFTEFSRRLWANIACHTLTDDELTVIEEVITVCSYDFANKFICIPKNIDKNGTQITITGIANGVFQDQGLISVGFPASLTTIGDDAFSWNHLDKVTFPAGLTTIGDDAFSWNHLDKVTFPAGLTTIGESAFSYNDLTSVTFPDNSSLTTIGYGAFYHNKLKTVSFSEPSNILIINAWAFSGNPSLLTKIKLPAFANSNHNVYIATDGDNEQNYYPNEDFPSDKFGWSLEANSEECYTLRNRDLTVNTQGVITACSYSFANKCIVIPSTYIDDNGEQKDITGIAGRSYPEKGVFEEEGLISVEFPASLKTIGESAFTNNDIESVTFPDKSRLTSIGSEAFSSNSSLASIKLPTFPEDSEHNVYIATYRSNEQKYYPGDDFPRAKFGWSLEASSEECYTLRNRDLTVNTQGVITACSYSFANKCIIIPENIDKNGETITITGIAGKTAIETEGIFEKKGITSVAFRANLDTIGARAFYGNSLTSLDFPTSLKTIGIAAFMGNSLTSVVFPNNSRLTSIGKYAFYENNSLLTGITLPTNSNGGFEGYKDSNGVEYDPDDNFEEFSRSLEATIVCDELTSDHLTVNTQGVITEYTNDATNGCIIIPENIDKNGETITITGIGEAYNIPGVFQSKGLTSVTFAKNPELKTIEDWAFSSNSLTTLDLSALSGLTSIGFEAFNSNNDLTSVDFPASLTSIGERAFSYSKLGSVTFPASLDTIKGGAFSFNALTSVTFPASLKTIGDYAFHYNQQLKSVLFLEPSNIQSIGAEAFSDNPLLEKIKLPTFPDSEHNVYIAKHEDNEEKYLPGQDFLKNEFNWSLEASFSWEECYTLAPEDLTISGGVITACSYDFANKCIIIPENIDKNGETITITGIAGETAIETEGIFEKKGITSVAFRANLDTIGARAFYGNSLTSLDFPTSLEIIEESAFYDNALTSVTFPENSSLTSIGSDAFSSNNRLAPIKLPTNSNEGFLGYVDSSGNMYDPNDDDDSNDDFEEFSSRIYADLAHILTLEDIDIDNNVITESHFAFESKKIIIPDSVVDENGKSIAITGISELVFTDFQLEAVILSMGLKTIGQEAFSNNQLKSLIIPTSLERIEDKAFYSNNLENVKFENDSSNILFIGKKAFDANSSLAEIVLPKRDESESFLVYRDGDDENYEIGASFTEFRTTLEAIIILELDDSCLDIDPNGIITKYKCDIKSIVIPNEVFLGNSYVEVKGIGFEVFYEKELVSVVLPESLISIGERAFDSNYLTEIVIPKKVTSIGEGAFESNDLTKIIIPKKVTSIGERGFINNRLVEVTFEAEAELESIGNEAFRYNLITEVTIPASVTTIGDYAFSNNKIIKLLFDADSKLEAFAKAVFYRNELEDVSIPASVTTIGGYAFLHNKLKEISIPVEVTYIGTFAFGFNNTLEDVSFTNESKIDTIGRYAFFGSVNNLEIKFPTHSNTYFEEYRSFGPNADSFSEGDHFTDFEKGYYTFLMQTLDKDGDCTIIETGIITECSNLEATNITIPTTINNIRVKGIESSHENEGVFANRNLTSVILPDDLTIIGPNTFKNNKLTSVSLPSKLEIINHNAFNDNKINSLTIPTSVNEIGNNAFYNNSLNEVTFDEYSNIQIIREGAFDENPLDKIKFPVHAKKESELMFKEYLDGNGNSSSEGDTFEDFSIKYDAIVLYTLQAKDLIVSNGTITGLQHDAKKTIEKYRSITIPKELNNANGTTEQIRVIKGITPPDDETGIFEDLDIIYVKFSESLTTIGRGAFKKDNESNFKIRKLNFEDASSLETIEQGAFYDNSLTSVTFPASLTTIGASAFRDNDLKKVTFDLDEDGKSSIQSIGNYAFNGNNNLSSITLPDNNNENFQRYIDSRDKIYEVGDSFSNFYPSYSIVTSDPSSSRMAIYDASHSDVEILEQPQPFTYYPNPVVSQLTVTANVGDRILMLNQVGVTVYDEVVTSVVAHQIDVTDFPRGVYLIRLISAEGSVITKRLAKH